MTNTRRFLILGLTGVLAGVGSVGHTQTVQQKALPSARATYRIDAKKSRFIVETETSGLSTMFAHDHKIELGDYTGTATMKPGSISGAALEITARAESMHLLDEKNIGERQAVESTLREAVLETTKYPEITFKTKIVTTERRGDGTYDVRLAGELRLHGVRRQVVLPARVVLEGDRLHAIGVFEIRQTDFNITPFSFVGGTVTIKDLVTVSFDIFATRA